MRWGSALALVMYAGIQSAGAAPVLTVRARTAIKLAPIHRVAGGIEVSGRLIDQTGRLPVAWATIGVRLDGEHTWLTTDDDGYFAHVFAVATGVHSLEVAYAGDRHHTPSTASIEGFDVTKEAVRLSLRSRQEVASSAQTTPVVVQAATDSGPVAIEVELSAAAIGPDELREPRLLARLHTDANGRAETHLAVSELGAPGRKQLKVRFAGNDAYDVASAVAELLVTTETTLDLRLDDRQVPFENHVVGRGHLRERDGNAVAGALVGLTAGGKRVADALTDREGAFTMKVSASELGAGRTVLQAAYESPDAWRRNARSAPAAVVVGDPRPVPIAYSIAAFAATAVTVMVLVSLRTRPWAALVARWRGGAATSRPPGPRSGPPEPAPPGFMPARPSLTSSLRRAQELDFTGQVRDCVTLTPVSGATLLLQHDGGATRTETASRQGSFRIDDLAAGQWAVVVSCDGYVAERFAVQIPHRGELRGTFVDLVPVREQIFRIYRRAALPLLPDPAKWGIWTPRQILCYVRSQGPAPALAELTTFVEDAYFSPRQPGLGALREAQQRALAATAEIPPSVV
jgi:hypothetical protein